MLNNISNPIRPGIDITKATYVCATVPKLKAMSGWSGGAMASHCTKRTDLRKHTIHRHESKSGSE